MKGHDPVAGTMRMALTVVIVVAVLKLAQEVLVPLALAILLSFLLAPMVEGLVRWRLNRVLAVILSLTLGLALTLGIGALLFNQFADLAHKLPSYQQQLRTNLTHLGGVLRGGVADTTRAIDELTREIDRVAPLEPRPRGVSKVQLVEPPTSAIDAIRRVVGSVARPVGTTLAVIVLVGFMLLRLPDLRDRVLSLLGSRNLHVTTAALNDTARRVSRYLLMQIVINGWTGMVVMAGLWALNVPNAILWGALVLVLRFIPYVGVWMAASIPLALSFAVFDDLSRPFMVFGLFALLELFDWAVLEPWLYGSHTGVSPVALLLAAGFWTWLWGFAGLFLAIPMTVCVVVMGKYIPQLQFLQVLLGDEPVLEPHERLYQRLLSSDRDEADAVLEGALRQSSLQEVCDTILVPTMLRVEEDHAHGTLKVARRQMVLEHIDQWVDEQLDWMLPSGTRGAAPVGSGWPVSVLCVPASARADEISAKLLHAALLKKGLTASVVSPADIASLLPSDGTLKAIVVCALPPEAVSAARAACKRIRSDDSSVPLLIGLWSGTGDLERARQRLAAAGAFRVATSYGECLDLLAGLAGQAAALTPAAASVLEPAAQA